jgi:hypothetical protein
MEPLTFLHGIFSPLNFLYFKSSVFNWVYVEEKINKFLVDDDQENAEQISDPNEALKEEMLPQPNQQPKTTFCWGGIIIGKKKTPPPRPQFLKTEDNLNFFENGRRPHFI